MKTFRTYVVLKGYGPLKKQKQGDQMKTYRIMYWFNSCITECYVRADTEEQAIETFKGVKGDKPIASIEEVKTIPSYCRGRSK